MADIEKDIQLLNETFNGTNYSKGNYHIWPRTSEDVNKVLEIIDVKDKDVYAVLSSSDILFSLINQKAKSIRTFDKNPLTYRYYYMRKWLLEYGILDGEELSFLEVRDIINAKRNYINKDEEESVRLWNLYLKRLDEASIRLWNLSLEKMDKEGFWLYDTKLFEYVSERYKCPYDEDIESLLAYLNQVELEFDNINLEDSELNNNHQYDIVYISNIMGLHDSHSVERIRDNLSTLLRDNGQVICTNLVNHPYFDFFTWERKIFEKKFIYDEIYTEIISHEPRTYYRYIKK